MNASWGGKVKIVTGNGAAQGPGARDQEAQDRNRARLPLAEPRRILVLGCTSGAGQSVTALHDRVHARQPARAPGRRGGPARRHARPLPRPRRLARGTAGGQAAAAHQRRPGRTACTRPRSRARPGSTSSPRTSRSSDGDEIKLAVQLNRHYPLTVLDPGAAGLTRLLKVTDQLVVVVPANADAAGALADTRDWLDNNGHADLAMQSVTVINGVSRRSLPDVEQRRVDRPRPVARDRPRPVGRHAAGGRRRPVHAPPADARCLHRAVRGARRRSGRRPGKEEAMIDGGTMSRR